MSRRRRVLLVHLNDDYSGASKMLSIVAATLLGAGHQVHALVGSSGTSGFVRDSVPHETYPYSFCGSRFALLKQLITAEWSLFWRVLRRCRRHEVDLVYVNTVLPAAAAIAARTCRVPVVVHLHEVGLGNASLFRILRFIAVRSADRLICVSRFVAERLQLPPSKATVIHNTMAPGDWIAADEIVRTRLGPPRSSFVVLMACSLKWYKGIDSFVELASRVAAADPGVEFRLILNADARDVERFMASTRIPQRLKIVQRPASVFDHYRDAALVVNLSHPEGWIETFGLTLLEAMACGIPVIAPRVGGCTELFAESQGGWRYDSRDLDGIAARIRVLREQPEVWQRASGYARAAAERFSPAAFEDLLERLVRSS